jgi:hypothetical protein
MRGDLLTRPEKSEQINTQQGVERGKREKENLSSSFKINISREGEKFKR